VAAGVLIVREAGGLPLIRRNGTDNWDPFENFFPPDNLPKNIDAARKWRRSLLVGNHELTKYIATHIRKVNRPGFWTKKRPGN
jgi:hypothetical protein